MEMKVIDLLNKIANGEEVPKKIKVNTLIYTVETDYNTGEVIDYVNHNDSLFAFDDGNSYCFINECLRWEVEIIEEDKKIEKLKIRKDYNGKGDFLINEMASTDYQMLQVVNKINEIIDKLEGKEWK